MTEELSGEIYERIIIGAGIKKIEIADILGFTHVAVVNAIKRGLSVPYLDALVRLLMKKERYGEWCGETDKLYLCLLAISLDLREVVNLGILDSLRRSLKSPLEQEEWLIITKVARLYGCSTKNIYRLRDDGLIEAEKRKGKWFFKREDILDKSGRVSRARKKKTKF